MTGFWPVLVREVRERRSILLAALALGFLPIVVGLIPAATLIGGSDVRDNVAVILGLAFPTAVALGLGASVIGRDVSEGRLGFYFSRPISGFALWAGKMGAIIILIGASALLISLPPRLVTAEGFLTGAVTGLAVLASSIVGAEGLVGPMGSHDPWFWRLAFGLLILGAASAHAAGTMLRSRSGILPIDLGLLLAALAAFAAAGWRIIDAGASEMFLLLMPTLLWTSLVAFLVAGAVQLVAGRSDSRRGHVFLSATLWGSLLVAAGVLHAALSWAFATAPTDLAFNRGSVSGAPQGGYFRLATFGGGRLGYNPSFLVNADSGHFARIGAADGSWDSIFAQQGRTAVWMRLGRQPSLAVAQMDEAQARVNTVVLAADVPDALSEWIMALSPAGERVLMQHPGGVAVVESATGRLVAQATTPRIDQAYFDSAERVRLYRRDGTGTASPIVLLEWNLRTGQVRETGRLDDAFAVMSRHAGRLLVTTVQGGLDVRNAETGQMERSLLGPNDYRASRLARGQAIHPRFLAVGGVAAIVSEAERDHLDLFPAAAGANVDVPLSGHRNFLVGESAPGELVMENWDSPAFQTLFVDAATGEVRKTENGLKPATWIWSPDYVRTESVPGSLSTRLFITPAGQLVNRDPATGERRVVFQGRPTGHDLDGLP